MSNAGEQNVLTLPPEVLANRFTDSGEWTHWDTAAVHDLITRDGP